MEIILIIIAGLAGALGILMAVFISEVIDLKEEMRTSIRNLNSSIQEINKNNTTHYY